MNSDKKYLVALIDGLATYMTITDDAWGINTRVVHTPISVTKGGLHWVIYVVRSEITRTFIPYIVVGSIEEVRARVNELHRPLTQVNEIDGTELTNLFDSSLCQIEQAPARGNLTPTSIIGTMIDVLMADFGELNRVFDAEYAAVPLQMKFGIFVTYSYSGARLLKPINSDRAFHINGLEVIVSGFTLENGKPSLGCSVTLSQEVTRAAKKDEAFYK